MTRTRTDVALEAPRVAPVGQAQPQVGQRDAAPVRGQAPGEIADPLTTCASC